MDWHFCCFYVPGLLLAFAYDDISYNKIATQMHTYVGTGYDAGNVVDRKTSTCMRTRVIGTGPSMGDRTVWWKVDLGGVYNIYSINILFKNYDGYVERQRGRFAGFSLYVSDSDVSFIANIKGSNLCYKDGPQLPPLNFTTVCTEKGRYVIYYNERLEGLIYPKGYEVHNVNTELCEVIVQGCNNVSVYGGNCDTPCHTNCKDGTCHIQNGTCFTCKPGWTGMYCTAKCKVGWYGVNCSQQCVGHCNDRTTCNHVTGQCDGGCDVGWTGKYCDIDCTNGFYGFDCTNTCSGHCLNDSPCNKQTGHCDLGCNPGYYNVYCSKACPPDHFGLECKERCSGHCKNSEPCDHVSGVCPSGCRDGYIGTHCNNSCNKGYFGTNCSRECSPNCKPDTCRHTDGWCTSCTAGWMGYKCIAQCVLSYGENCKYPCNVFCINQTCDRINGSCLNGCKYGYHCNRDIANYMISYSPSSHLPTLIGGLVGASMFTIIGVVVAIFVTRRKSSNTKCHTSVLKFCLRPTRPNTEDTSNYQDLNFSLGENPYQSISR